ncbi:Peptidase domain protein [Candidatus Sulfopaludibacter sp. SbA3]|nr:Peptidase domain protein [Candidatus Sulfopaludibacter sp. SbA3]
MKFCIALLAAAAALAQQQQPVPPHIGFLYPAGGRQGTTFEVTLGGQNVAGAYEVYLSGSGVQATVTKYARPLTPAQANTLREQMQKLVEQKTASTKPPAPNTFQVIWTPADEAALADIRAKLMDFQRRPSSPAIAETVVLQVTIGAQAEPGERELRLGVTAGITNPILLQVGQLPEFTREVSKVPPALNAVNGATPQVRAVAPPHADPPVDINLPTVINGQMMPAAVDRYRFHATKGQHLVAEACARELIPYISDAVPGWFQATLTLRDSAGKQVAYADHFYFHPDPVIHYDVPADGDYTLEIHDSIYRGREDFVYRISVGELPYLTSIFPLGGRAGARTSVAVQGWNLPAASLAETGKAKGLTPVAVQSGPFLSNRLPFAFDTLPEAVAKEPIGKREKAQKVKLPLTVNGRIAKPGEWDFFRFDGKAGEEIVAEVFARRLDSPLDSVLILTDAAGKQLAANDDFEDKGAGLLTHQADSRICFKLPAKGSYYLQVGDTQRQSGPDYAYRLRISHPEPDFDLRVVPSSLNVRGGATVPVTVYALRHDGFTGEISLKLKDAPQGLVMSGGTIPAGQDKIRLTLTAPAGPLGLPAPVQLEGHASIEGHEVHRLAVPAEDMMQAFAYHHLVAEKDWMVRVIGQGAPRAPVRPASEKAVKLSAGGSVPFQVIVAPRLAGQVQLELNDPPAGIKIEKVTTAPEGLAVTLTADPAKAKPGLRGNLILDVYLERPDAKTAVRRRQLWGTLPAIPFEVVGTLVSSR